MQTTKQRHEASTRLERGTVHSIPPPHSPQFNGVTEQAEAARTFTLIKDCAPHWASGDDIPLAICTDKISTSRSVTSMRMSSLAHDANFGETNFHLLASASTPPHSTSSMIRISIPPEVAPPLPAPAPAPLQPSTPAAGAAPSPPAPIPARIALVPPFTPPPQAVPADPNPKP
ncbi:hypothetical protein JCM5350_008332 [Sporobolomyces pararoseus]